MEHIDLNNREYRLKRRQRMFNQEIEKMQAVTKHWEFANVVMDKVIKVALVATAIHVFVRFVL